MTETVSTIYNCVTNGVRKWIHNIITIIKTTSEDGDGDGRRDWLAGDGGRGRSGRGRHTYGVSQPLADAER